MAMAHPNISCPNTFFLVLISNLQKKMVLELMQEARMISHSQPFVIQAFLFSLSFLFLFSWRHQQKSLFLFRFFFLSNNSKSRFKNSNNYEFKSIEFSFLTSITGMFLFLFISTSLFKNLRWIEEQIYNYVQISSHEIIEYLLLEGSFNI